MMILLLFVTDDELLELLDELDSDCGTGLPLAANPA
jgi:hypothetical protein